MSYSFNSFPPPPNTFTNLANEYTNKNNSINYDLVQLNNNLISTVSKLYAQIDELKNTIRYNNTDKELKRILEDLQDAKSLIDKYKSQVLEKILNLLN